MYNRRTVKIKDMLYMLNKHRKRLVVLIVLAGFLGIGLTVVSYYMSGTETINKATASFAVVAENKRGNYASNSAYPQSQDIYLAENMVNSVIYVCTSDAVLEQVVSNLGLFGVTASSIRNALTITQYQETQIIELALYWPYPNEGVNILTEITNVAPDILVETLGLGSVTTINQAKITTVEQRWNTQYLLGSVVVAVGIGLVYSFLGLIVHPTLLDVKEVRNLFDLDTLTELPYDPLCARSAGRLSVLDGKASSNFYRDSMDSAVHILNYKLKGENPCLFITSSMEGEGKTSVVAYLGMEFAHLGKRVLLIDMDLQNPSLSEMFLHRPQYEHSLNAAVNDDIPLKDAIVPLEKNLDLVPTRLEKNRIVINQRVRDIVDVLKEDYDIILIDTAPVGQVSDTMQLNLIADMAIYVIRYDAVWIDVIQDNIDKLRKSGTEILGCVVNAVDRSGDEGARFQDRYYGREYSGGLKGQEKAKKKEQTKGKKLGNLFQFRKNKTKKNKQDDQE